MDPWAETAAQVCMGWVLVSLEWERTFLMQCVPQVGLVFAPVDALSVPGQCSTSLRHYFICVSLMSKSANPLKHVHLCMVLVQ